MTEDRIAALTVIGNVSVSTKNVRTGRAGVISIVHQDNNMFFLETPLVHNVILHVETIIVATGELAILASVVDT